MTDFQIPMKRLLAPQTAPALFTVKGKALKITTGTLQAIGHDGLAHVLPVIENFGLSDALVPIDDIGQYIGGVLLPNTMVQIGKYAASGVLRLGASIIFNDGKRADGPIKDIIDPAAEALTKDPILGGAGMTVKQLEDWTGINHKDMGTGKVGGGYSTAKGNAYRSVTIDGLKEDDGIKFGRYLGLMGYKESAIEANLNGVTEVINDYFKKDSKTILSNSKYMKGLYEGIQSGKGYSGYRISSDSNLDELPSYCHTDEFGRYKKAA